ncbi:MAG: ABC transporter permease, partial [Patescibacteria group bacterium]|nr:ABC transporter permease [Patescibacteria group bacterium]
MYKLLLSWRYLRTRWIALASIISVMLGVATMIVVNSVMAGFTREMQTRIHGILSDVIVTSRSLHGVPDAEYHMEQIREIAGNVIEDMSPTVVVPAMLSFQYDNNWITRQVQLIGIDEKTQGKVSDFCLYLQHPENRKRMSFDLREDGYDTGGLSDSLGTPVRPQMADAGWQHRRRMASLWKFEQRMSGRSGGSEDPAHMTPANAGPGNAGPANAAPGH